MPKPLPGIMVDTMDIPDTMDIMVMDTDLDTDMLILMDTMDIPDTMDIMVMDTA